MLRRILVAASIVFVALTSTAAVAVPAGATPPGEVAAAAPCGYNGAHPTLRNGSTGEAVAHLQCLLRNVWDYGNVAVDGQFGPVTESAVITHQRDCHIGVDGVVGPDTWRHLHPDTTTSQCTDAGRN
jgi:lysozyme